MEKEETMERTYVISSRELKEKLGIEGSISLINLFAESKEIENDTTWEIATSEKKS